MHCPFLLSLFWVSQKINFLTNSKSVLFAFFIHQNILSSTLCCPSIGRYSVGILQARPIPALTFNSQYCIQSHKPNFWHNYITTASKSSWLQVQGIQLTHETDGSLLRTPKCNRYDLMNQLQSHGFNFPHGLLILPHPLPGRCLVLLSWAKGSLRQVELWRSILLSWTGG